MHKAASSHPPPLDRRQHAFRPDLADVRLRGQVEAPQFVVGQVAEVGTDALPLLREPASDAPMESQLLPGEVVCVFERANGWSWVQCGHDGYVGYVASDGLTEQKPAAPTHVVNVRETVVLSDDRQVCRPLGRLSLGASIRVEEQGERFHKLESGGYVFSEHMRAMSFIEKDWVSVAQRLLGLPYLWGGRGAGGIDCSGLVQVTLGACGIPSPRDTDQQAVGLGHAVPLDPAAWQRGDAIYVPGHVVLDVGDGSVIHATGYRWAVVQEPRHECLERMAAKGRPVVAVRRPAPLPDP